MIGYATSPIFRKVFLALSSMWKTVGIRTKLQPFDSRAYNVAVTEGRFDVFSYATFAVVPGVMFFLDRFLSSSPVNFARWRNAEFDRLLLAAQRESDVARRSAGFTTGERLLLREFPVTPMWIGSSNRLVSSRVTGWVDHPGHAHPSQYLGSRATYRGSDLSPRQAPRPCPDSTQAPARRAIAGADNVAAGFGEYAGPGSLGRWVAGSQGRRVAGSLGRRVAGSQGRRVAGSQGRRVAEQICPG